MIERQAKHRQGIEKEALHIAIKNTKLNSQSQVFAFIITLIVLGIGTFLTLKGFEKTGLTLFGTTLISIVASF